MMKPLHRFRVIAYAVIALFSASLVAHAQSPAARKASAQAAKVSTDLLTVINNGGVTQQSSAEGLQRVNLFMTQGNSIAISAVANSEQEGQALLQSLQALGLTKGRVLKQQVTGYLPIDELGNLKNISVLRFARPTYKPIHNVGSVTSQGDTSLRSNIARATYDVDGAGVKIGVLSDSYDRLGGAAAGVASGDLPMGVDVLQEFSGDDGTDEGRAMIELIHDVAPGSPQAFYTASEGQLGFAEGIRALAAAGCKVITDDIVYFTAPFFQDGPVAQAVDDVVNNSGVTYFSAAGNSARQSYQSAYRPTTQPASPGYYVAAHDFGGGDKFQSLTVGPGQTVIISFQWDDPFFSVSGGSGARTDMDLLLYFNGTFLANLSSQSGNIGDDPVEITGLQNTGSTPLVIDLVFAKYEDDETGPTPDPTLVKWINFGSNVPTEYDTKSSTIIGHSNAEKAIAVGAAPFYRTPAYNNTLTTANIEPFSSAGGTPILFSTDGTRLGSPVVRQKPEITSVDGGNTTFFFSDTSRDVDTFPNFFGTSAAAPHAAGVAALMKQKVSGISPAAILTALENTALDMDDPATPGFDTGFDFGTGYGFIQADKALQSILPANPSFAITGVTTISCSPDPADPNRRVLTFTPQYSVLNGQPITFSVANEKLPTTEPGPYTLKVYIDNPTITLKASQQGTSGQASFAYNWLAVCGTTPPNPDPDPVPTDFAITGVTTVSCSPVPGNQNKRSLTFTPMYSGTNGQPVTFSVANEKLPTTAPGPYTLGIYTDNPVITLKATQQGTSGEAIFVYNWLAACSISGARLGAEPEENNGLQVILLGNPVEDGRLSVLVRGVASQSVNMSLTDIRGKVLGNHKIERAGQEERYVFELNRQPTSLLLLKVSTPTETKTVKVLKVE